MSRADEIARRKMLEAEQQQRSKAEAAQAARAQGIAEIKAAVPKAIRAALDSLERRDFPGVLNLKCQEEYEVPSFWGDLFGRPRARATRTYHKGGWPVGSLTYWDHGDQYYTYFYLLSDGRIMQRPLDVLVEWDYQSLDDLEELRLLLDGLQKLAAGHPIEHPHWF